MHCRHTRPISLALPSPAAPVSLMTRWPIVRANAAPPPSWAVLVVTVLHSRIADWTRHTPAPMALLLLQQVVMGSMSSWWWWLQHPSKDDEACAISGKRTTSNSKLNTSIRCGVRRGACPHGAAFFTRELTRAQAQQRLHQPPTHGAPPPLTPCWLCIHST